MQVIKQSVYKAKYSVHRPKRINSIHIDLPNYRQEDYHTCGFLAALTVSEYLQTGFSAEDVLGLIKPTIDGGVSRKRMISALNKMGVTATYRDDLTILNLVGYVAIGLPVIISVLPDYWYTDHWTVLNGFSDTRVHLTNHNSLSLKRFMREWVENWDEGELGAGLICERSGE